MVWRALGFLLVLALVPAAVQADRHPGECFLRGERSTPNDAGETRVAGRCTLFLSELVQVIGGRDVSTASTGGNDGGRMTWGLEGQLDDDANLEVMLVGHYFVSGGRFQPFVKAGFGGFWESAGRPQGGDGPAILAAFGFDLQLNNYCGTPGRCMVLTLRLVPIEAVTVFSDPHRYIPRFGIGIGIRFFE